MDGLLTGMSPRHARIYQLCLETGKMPASSIARNLHLPRATVYQDAQDMVQQGRLQKTTVGKVSYFLAQDPRILYARMQEQFLRAEQDLPMRESLYHKQQKHNADHTIVEGLDGIKQLYHDQLTSTVPLKSFLSELTLPQELSDFFFQEFLPLRKNYGLMAHKITTNSDLSKAFQSLDTTYFRQTTTVQGLSLGIGNEVVMYGPDKIAIAIFDTRQYRGVIITNHELYTTMVGVFDYVYAMQH